MFCCCCSESKSPVVEARAFAEAQQALNDDDWKARNGVFTNPLAVKGQGAPIPASERTSHSSHTYDEIPGESRAEFGRAAGASAESPAMLERSKSTAGGDNLYDTATVNAGNDPDPLIPYNPSTRPSLRSMPEGPSARRGTSDYPLPSLRASMRDHAYSSAEDDSAYVQKSPAVLVSTQPSYEAVDDPLSPSTFTSFNTASPPTSPHHASLPSSSALTSFSSPIPTTTTTYDLSSSSALPPSSSPIPPSSSISSASGMQMRHVYQNVVPSVNRASKHSSRASLDVLGFVPDAGVASPPIPSTGAPPGPPVSRTSKRIDPDVLQRIRVDSVSTTVLAEDRYMVRPPTATEKRQRLLAFLQRLQLAEYTMVLQADGVDDIATLKLYSVEALTKLGIKGGHARKLVAAVAEESADGFGATDTGRGTDTDSPGATAAAAATSSFSSAGVSRQPSGSAIVAKTSPWREYAASKLTLEGELTSGRFGRVRRAWADGVIEDGCRTVVAVREIIDEEDLQRYLDTALKIDTHPNIAVVIGLCTARSPPLLLTELGLDGCLHGYLNRARESGRYLLSSALVSFAADVARALEFLGTRDLVHRDVSSRNVVIFGYVAKLMDLGYSGCLPSRVAANRMASAPWLAPECFGNAPTFSAKSDVWAFGVLLWELSTMGATPYPGVFEHALPELLKQGYRMAKPSTCSAPLYQLMSECWAAFPLERPSFVRLARVLGEMVPEENHITAGSGDGDGGDETVADDPHYVNVRQQNHVGPGAMKLKPQPLYVNTVLLPESNAASSGSGNGAATVSTNSSKSLASSSSSSSAHATAAAVSAAAAAAFASTPGNGATASVFSTPMGNMTVAREAAETPYVYAKPRNVTSDIQEAPKTVLVAATAPALYINVPAENVTTSSAAAAAAAAAGISSHAQPLRSSSPLEDFVHEDQADTSGMHTVVNSANTTTAHADFFTPTSPSGGHPHHAHPAAANSSMDESEFFTPMDAVAPRAGLGLSGRPTDSDKEGQQRDAPYVFKTPLNTVNTSSEPASVYDSVEPRRGSRERALSARGPTFGAATTSAAAAEHEETEFLGFGSEETSTAASALSTSKTGAGSSGEENPYAYSRPRNVDATSAVAATTSKSAASSGAGAVSGAAGGSSAGSHNVGAPSRSAVVDEPEYVNMPRQSISAPGAPLALYANMPAASSNPVSSRLATATTSSTTSTSANHAVHDHAGVHGESAYINVPRADAPTTAPAALYDETEAVHAWESLHKMYAKSLADPSSFVHRGQFSELLPGHEQNTGAHAPNTNPEAVAAALRGLLGNVEHLQEQGEEDSKGGKDDGMDEAQAEAWAKFQMTAESEDEMAHAGGGTQGTSHSSNEGTSAEAGAAPAIAPVVVEEDLYIVTEEATYIVTTDNTYGSVPARRLGAGGSSRSSTRSADQPAGEHAEGAQDIYITTDDDALYAHRRAARKRDREPPPAPRAPPPIDEGDVYGTFL